jgi:hypothetical protein
VEKWEEAEVNWIALCKQLGFDLCNHTKGGDGVHSPDAETRKKLSEIQKKRMADPIYRAKIFTKERAKKLSIALTGKKKTKEHVAKLKQNQKGGKLSDEHKQKLAKASMGNQYRKGIPTSPEIKERLSRALKGNTHTKGRVMPEHEKVQRSVALKGKPFTEEHKEKIKQAQLKAWAKRKANKDLK